MKKGWLTTKSSGFSLVEIILASSLFALLILGLSGAFLYGQENTALSGKRARAVFLAEEGLEVARNIRDEDFANLADGTYGLAISGNQWAFSGSSDATDIFTRQVVVGSVDADRKQVTSTVTWQQNPQRTGSVSLVTYLANWQASAGGPPASTCAEFCQSASYSSGVCRQNTKQCEKNDEIYESAGDLFCTAGQSADTCCCLP